MDDSIGSSGVSDSLCINTLTSMVEMQCLFQFYQIQRWYGEIITYNQRSNFTPSRQSALESSDIG